MKSEPPVALAYDGDCDKPCMIRWKYDGDEVVARVYYYDLGTILNRQGPRMLFGLWRAEAWLTFFQEKPPLWSMFLSRTTPYPIIGDLFTFMISQGALRPMWDAGEILAWPKTDEKGNRVFIAHGNDFARCIADPHAGFSRDLLKLPTKRLLSLLPPAL